MFCNSTSNTFQAWVAGIQARSHDPLMGLSPHRRQDHPDKCLTDSRAQPIGCQLYCYKPMTPDVQDHAHLLAEIVAHTPNNPLACNIINSISKGNPLTGWHLQDNLLCFKDRTYVPDQISLCLQVIRNHHDHPTSGHFGQHKCQRFPYPNPS